MFKQLAADVAPAARRSTARRRRRAGARRPDRRGARAAAPMTAGKSDPRYGDALAALTAARSGRRRAAVRRCGVASRSSPAPPASRRRSPSRWPSCRPAWASCTPARRSCRAASPSSSKGNAELAAGIGKLSGGGGQLTTGLGALRDGAAALETGLGQLTPAPASSQAGLARGHGPDRPARRRPRHSSRPASRSSAASLPSTKDLEQLQRESPGLFDSGYFVLAAIAGRAGRPAQPGLVRGQPRPRRQRRADHGRSPGTRPRTRARQRARRGPPALASTAFARGDRHRGRRRRPGRLARRLPQRDRRADLARGRSRSPSSSRCC